MSNQPQTEQAEPLLIHAHEAAQLLGQRFTEPGYENWRTVNNVHLRFTPSVVHVGKRRREMLWEANGTWCYLVDLV